MEWFERAEKPLLAITAGAMLLTGLGSVALFNWDEGLFAEGAREMLAGGDWIIAHVNGHPYYDKPILTYWLQAASAWLFGVNELAFRLPSALAAFAWIGAAYCFTRRYYGGRAAYLAAFFILVGLQTTIIAKAAIADALLNCCIALSMFLLYRFYDSNERRWLWLAAAAAAVGVLTKGPIALAIPGVTVFLFSILQRRFRFFLRAAFDPIAWLIGLAVAGPWYALAIRSQGMDFIRQTILSHNVDRFWGTAFEGHSGSLFYYAPIVVVGMLPFTALLFVVLMRIKHLWREPLAQFLLIWFLFVFVFFSLATTKLHHYVVYGYTPMLVLMAVHAEKIRSRWLLVLPTLLLFLLLALVPLILPRVLPYIHDPRAAAQLSDTQDIFDWRFSVPIIAAMLALAALPFWRKLSRPALLTAIGLIFTAIVNYHLLPVVAEVMHEPVKRAALMMREQNTEVLLYKTVAPSFMVYMKRLLPERSPKPGDIVFTEVPRLKELGGYETLFQQHGYALIRCIEGRLDKPGRTRLRNTVE